MRDDCAQAGEPAAVENILRRHALRGLRAEVERAVDGSAPVLILGESGTGKTALAHAIAEASGRRPVVRVFLGASDDLNTVASELFGHERGAFSGATGRRIGLVEHANNGTLIMDEVLNMHPHAQRLLLDFAQFGTYRPLGYDRPEPKRTHTRLIAATNGDLSAAIRDGSFRLDLYYRLAGTVIELPALRNARDDIPSLAENILSRFQPVVVASRALLELLMSPKLDWAGNVRQLERVLVHARERALSGDPLATEIGPFHLVGRDLEERSPAPAENVRAGRRAVNDLTWHDLERERTRLRECEAELIRRALANAGGNVARAARELRIPRTTLVSRMATLQLD